MAKRRSKKQMRQRADVGEGETTVIKRVGTLKSLLKRISDSSAKKTDSKK